MLDRSLHPLLQEIENWGESSWRSEYSRQQRAAESHGPAAFSIEPPAPHIRRHKVQSACRKYIPGYDKSPPCEELFERFHEAEERAIALNKWHALPRHGRSEPHPPMRTISPRNPLLPPALTYPFFNSAFAA